jgi:hypothetical protein
MDDHMRGLLTVDCLQERNLKVVLPAELSAKILEKAIIPSLVETLQLDPRPSYHDDPEREYGMSFAGYNIRFKVSGGILTVTDVQNSPPRTYCQENCRK